MGIIKKKRKYTIKNIIHKGGSFKKSKPPSKPSELSIKQNKQYANSKKFFGGIKFRPIKGTIAAISGVKSVIGNALSSAGKRIMFTN